MPVQHDLKVYQSNVEVIDLTITQESSGSAQNLTGATVECYLKPDANTADNDSAVTILSTATSGVLVTSASGGLVTVTIPSAALATAGTRWWRVDVIISSVRRTCVFGPMYVIDV